jgi:hypothetical protein
MTSDSTGPGSAGPGSDAAEGGAAGSGGPLLALLARGLEIWLRQQCEAIDQLEIRLDGSAGQLLRGRLPGVHLAARGVVYQQLEIEWVELRSETIQVRMGALLRRQTVELEQPFRVRGQVAFSGEGLSRSLIAPQWRELGDGLAEQLLGLGPLRALRIQEDRLVLSGLGLGADAPVERAARLTVHGSGLELHPLDGGESVLLPIDPDIRIERAALGGGLLELEGEAKVVP